MAILKWKEQKKIDAEASEFENRFKFTCIFSDAYYKVRDFVVRKVIPKPKFKKLSELSMELKGRLSPWSPLINTSYQPATKELHIKLTILTSKLGVKSTDRFYSHDFVAFINLELSKIYGIISSYLNIPKPCVMDIKPVELQKPNRLTPDRYKKLYDSYYTEIDKGKHIRSVNPYAVEVILTYGSIKI